MLNLWNSLTLLEDFSGPKYLALMTTTVHNIVIKNALEFDTTINVSVMMKTSFSVVRSCDYCKF